MNNIGLGIQLNTLHRTYTGTDAGLLALFSVYELLHNFQNLVSASQGNSSDKWAVQWYQNQLKTEYGKLYFRPEIKKYIKKWYITERKWENIVKEAEKEYCIMLEQRGIKKSIEKLLEKALRYMEPLN